MSRRLAVRAPALVVCALSLALVSPARAAQTILVDSLADTVDSTPVDGTCQSPCTLRGAIQTANGALSPGPDTITLPANTYNRTIGGADVGPDPAMGDLDITGELTITGGGQSTTTINGNNMERVFDIAPGATVVISGVTITGGSATDGDAATAGGGVRVGKHGAGAATLTLNDVTLSANQALDGAGVATDADGSSLTLNRVSVLDNIAPASSSEGAGVNERFGGTVAINQSLVRGNRSQAGAGVTEDGGGTITITDSVVTDNHTVSPGGQAGGVYETGGGKVTITRSTVSKNTSAEGGGVVEDGGGTVTIVDSTIRENGTVGGTFLDAGGVLKDGGGTVTIRGSTIVGNTAKTGAGIQDYGPTGSFDVVNTTISGNHASSRGGGIQTEGPGALTLTNVTLHNNLADAGANEIDSCTGIPACVGTPHTITLRNTIVASGGVNCFGAITSAGHNIDSGNTCGVAGTGDMTNADPLLAALADNGGPTFTHAVLDGSPAIDRGDPATCPAVDQRGVARPLGPVCDIGAFERPVPVVTIPVTQQTPLVPTTSPAACLDRLAPISSLKRAGLRGVGGLQLARAGAGLVLTGKSRDQAGPCASGLQKVQVSLARVKGRTGVNCRFLKAPDRNGVTKPRTCRRPVLFTAKGTENWTFSFPVELQPGLYRAQVRGTDKAKNKETPKKRRSIVFFEVR